MSLQIYVYDAAASDEPQLVVELDDLDEAVSRCHDLVESDGHARAEAWDEDGDCRYGVALRGDVVRTYGAPTFDLAPPLVVPPVADAPPLANAPLANAPLANAPLANGPLANGPRADAPTPAPPAVPVDLLQGEKPLPPERWFGL